jgi:hypothetical protein
MLNKGAGYWPGVGIITRGFISNVPDFISKADGCFIVAF